MEREHKENMTMGQSSLLGHVKAEPQETRLGNSILGLPGGEQAKVEIKPNPLVPYTGSVAVKPEPSTLLAEDVEMQDSLQSRGAAAAPSVQFTKFVTFNDINYTPEGALQEGLDMVKAISQNVKRLELGSKLRRDVWDREIESLKNQAAPTTMIAVCGATGAGKSSILNAILDDNIVPTSGMRACTAVVTEIGYHVKKTIDGDVSFLSEKEWRDELAVLLDDLVDEDGNLKRSTDLRSDAGVAWSKVHAVYPTVTQEQLVKMSVDQIITRDPRISEILGTVKRISSNDSKTFAKEIGKYIDSKDQKRGEKKKDKKGKGKEKEKAQEVSKGASLLAKFRQDLTARTKANNADKDDDLDGPAFWPLIRQVNVRCNAEALSTGAVLVDLPGVADANAARNNIAKDYMKKCDCIWILAPITRAVDDKTARDLMGDAFKMQLMMDGNYDDNAITFIATKCDDISCSEVLRALNLEEDPELEAIEDQLDTCKVETDDAKDRKANAEAAAKEIDKTLKTLRPMLSEYKDHLKALKNGESFTPVLTAKKPQNKKKRARSSTPNSDDEASAGKKRKRSSGGAEKSSKRRKHADMDDDDDFIDDDEELEFSDEEVEADDRKTDDESGDEDESDKESSDTESGDNGADEEMEEEVTEDSLQDKIEEYDNAIKEGRVALSEQRRLRKEAVDQLATLRKKQDGLQREKNAFCSLKRSEFSRDVLKEDFRVGLKDLDDAAAEQRDPDSFDPTIMLRDYDAIELPVFTVSSRDYVRIKGQVKGDGEPACFSNIEDTGVPELQKWCHSLTVSSRERAARNFLTHLKTFANSVRTYVQGIGDVTVVDREIMREKWESSMPDDHEDPFHDFMMPFDMSGLNLTGLADQILGGSSLYKMAEHAPKVDRFGEPVGVTPRLIKDFQKVVDDCVHHLQNSFRDGLEEKCQAGAANAANAAVETSDSFAASMHWATYRATLRRHGSWRQDLNVELGNPFTRQIASSWSKVFETDLFASFEKAANDTIKALLKEIEDSATIGLKERAKGQGELSLDEAKVALRKTLDIVRDTINMEQKEVSRCLAPHVQNQLVDGYDRAMEERGTGSVARQKALFHNHVNGIKHEVFEGAAEVIMGRLSKAAEAVGQALEEALAELAEKIEVSVAVLWEGPRDDPTQVKVRTQVVQAMTEIDQQVHNWTQAAIQNAQLKKDADMIASGSD